MKWYCTIRATLMTVVDAETREEAMRKAQCVDITDCEDESFICTDAERGEDE